jgi:hypothetical protein
MKPRYSRPGIWLGSLVVRRLKAAK